jgi:hypothetical protein
VPARAWKSRYSRTRRQTRHKRPKIDLQFDSNPSGTAHESKPCANNQVPGSPELGNPSDRWEVVMSTLLLRCLLDDSGSEVLEYALMVGMLGLGCLVIVGSLTLKMVERWRDIFEAI